MKYFCLAEICPYTFLNCFLNFLLLISNSVSMSMTMYNLKEIKDTIEFGIILSSLITSMFCVAIKQSTGIEKYIKIERIKHLVNNKDIVLEELI